MVCNECNAKNSKNDKFCRNCGKKLSEVAEVKAFNNLESFLKNTWKDIKGMFIKPVDTAERFIKDDNYVTSLIYLSANILVIALSILIAIKCTSGVFNSYLGLDYSYIDGFYETIKIPYFRIFLVTIMTCVIIYGLVAGVSYLVCNYLFKSNTSFKKMLTWVGINSLFNTIICLIVALGVLMSAKLGIFLYLVGSILYAYNLFKSLEYVTDTDKNKLGYVLTISIITTLLVVVVILPNIF
ncbi:MAG: zinc ribbon domain-containing protein [Firmicutes bacterium]|nr:zinc ribbon domain-containing protein [Bacillota bacterium]